MKTTFVLAATVALLLLVNPSPVGAYKADWIPGLEATKRAPAVVFAFKEVDSKTKARKTRGAANPSEPDKAKVKMLQPGAASGMITDGCKPDASKSKGKPGC